MADKYISMKKVNVDRTLRKEAAQIYEARLRSPSTLVFDFRVKDHPLFVCLTPELHALIVDIYRRNAQLSMLQYHELPEIAIQWYITRILIDEIKLTNDMENVHSTRKEVKDAMESVESVGSPSDLRFSGMAAKYLSLIRHQESRLTTCGEVRKLYDEFVEREVIAEKASDALDGQIFRKSPVYVLNHRRETIHEGVYPESAIIDSMERALMILNDPDIDCMIRVAVFHYLFGYIHPFYNGNGRLSRYISSMILSGELNTLAGLRLSYVIKEHKRQYDKLFKDSNDARGMGDLTDFVTAFCRYIDTSLKDIVDTLSDGLVTIESIERIILSIPALKKHKDVIRILGFNGIFAEDPLSMEELMAYADCGRKNVQNALDTARDMGMLTQTTSRRKYLYTIKPEVWSDLSEYDPEDRTSTET